MKNLLLPFLVLAVLTLSSCYKTWTCECTTTYTSRNNPDSVYIKKRESTYTGFKKAKKEECENTNHFFSGEFSDTEFVNNECKLK